MTSELTTQYMDEVERLADRIAVVDRGRVIALGTAGELKDRIGGDRIELTVHDEIAVETARRVLAPLAVGDVQTDVGALHVTVPVAKGAASLTDALARLAGEGVGVRDAGLRRPTLDDVFLTLTGHEALATGDDGEAALTKEYSK